jgi:predicted MFS family arabinose efflux permease
MAATGAVLTGFGYALVYPGLGVEAVRRTPPDRRGLAMGIYTAFLDVARGLGSPALGLIAGWAGLSSVFLASTLIVLCAIAIAVRLLVAASPGKEQSWSQLRSRRLPAALALAVASTVWQAKAGFTAPA